MLTSMQRTDPWLRIFIGLTLVAAVVQLFSSSLDRFTFQPFERILSSVGVASIYACYLAGRFFGTNKAKAAQGVFMASGFFAIALSALRMADKELSLYLVAAQLIIHVGLSMMFLLINGGISTVMAMNFLRVRSGRRKGILEIASGLAISLMMLSVLFPWPHEIHAPVCAMIAAVCQLMARDT